MAFTETGYSTAGRVYDVNEASRLNEFANKFNILTEEADRSETIAKDVVRYSIITVGSVLIFVLLTVALTKKTKKK